jgi:hypothetical protein
MEKLDNNALFKVLTDSEPIEVMQLCVVNKKLAKLCKTPGVFGRLLELHFPKKEFPIAYEWFEEKSIRDKKVLDPRNMYIRLTENYGVRYKIRIQVKEYDIYGDKEFELKVAKDAYKIKTSDVNKPLDPFEYYFRVPGFKNLKNGVLIIEEIETHDNGYNVGINESISFFDSMGDAYDWFYKILPELAEKEYYNTNLYGNYRNYENDDSDDEYDIYKTKSFLQWLSEWTNIPNLFDKDELFDILLKDKYIEIGNSKYNFLLINLNNS